MADDNERDQPVSAEGAESAAADPESEPADLPARIDAGVARILQAFEEKLKYDASKQQAVDRLHSELQGHRAGLVEKVARPFIFGMIRHHAEIGKLLAGLRDIPKDELSPVKFGRLLKSLDYTRQAEPITDGVITCPAYFGFAQKEATRQAGEIAGLNVRYVIPEPTAAAVFYGMSEPAAGDQTVLVYDLGPADIPRPVPELYSPRGTDWREHGAALNPEGKRPRTGRETGGAKEDALLPSTSC